MKNRRVLALAGLVAAALAVAGPLAAISSSADSSVAVKRSSVESSIEAVVDGSITAGPLVSDVSQSFAQPVCIGIGSPSEITVVETASMVEEPKPGTQAGPLASEVSWTWEKQPTAGPLVIEAGNSPAKCGDSLVA